MTSKGEIQDRGPETAPALLVSQRSEAYRAGARAASQGAECEPPTGYSYELQGAWLAGWLDEWQGWFESERLRSECGALADNWPDDSGGQLCQMCWEKACTDVFWELFAAAPGSWADPGPALPEEAARWLC